MERRARKAIFLTSSGDRDIIHPFFTIKQGGKFNILDRKRHDKA